MKILFLTLIFATIAAAQVRHEVCYRTVNTGVTPNTISERCVILSVALRQALVDWNTAQGKTVTVGTKPNGTPITELQLPYRGFADAVFQTLQQSLFAPALDQFPTPSMVKLKTTADLSAAAVHTEKVNVLPILPSTEP